MLTLSRSALGVGAVTLAVWALAAGSAGYWGLRIWTGAGAGTAATPVAVVPALAIDGPAMARVLGATAAAAAAPVSLASRLALKGVVATPGGGAALIGVDGKPAQPFTVGAVVEEGLVLQSVAGRQATLGATVEGPALMTLELPPLKP